ncbi:aldose 1-epimerase [Sphingomonas rhizophila]|uniref:Aldose 1-epimerase n=1 Tax=Sphingomonas rhizophila TaxID=2071607 RepID=A0A7G9SBD4_9SPHN|nr:aldose 1-epimerase [Sphingomonas rhizophila]QNN65159.1 aldose 1-epimerase [Sphingomonas rhizophila]
MTPTVALRNGPAECLVAPALGGSILAWRIGGIDILRPAAAGAVSPLELASFPLVPFANRIAHGRFRFDEIDALPGPHPVADPHALHGHGWESAWIVVDQSDRSVMLEFERPGDDAWPWTYRARQHIELDPLELRTAITIENLSPQPMPAGAGIHPYFPRFVTSRVTAVAKQRWDNDASGLAVASADDTRFADGSRSVDELEGLDHFFPASDPVRISAPAGDIEIPLGDAAGFHLYVPTGLAHFCVEPVTHPPDALGRGDREAMAVLSPGERRTWHFPLRWTPS